MWSAEMIKGRNERGDRMKKKKKIEEANKMKIKVYTYNFVGSHCIRNYENLLQFSKRKGKIMELRAGSLRRTQQSLENVQSTNDILC